MRSGLTSRLARIAIWAFLLSTPIHAQSPRLTFPLVASGNGIDIEIILTNPGALAEEGQIVFWNDDGTPLELLLDGSAVSRVPFSISPAGSFKVETQGVGNPRFGYATVVSDSEVSTVSGQIIYTLAGSQVSVPASPLSPEYHVFVERSMRTNSGLAFANPLPRRASILLSLFNTEGVLKREALVVLEPREKKARFISEFFSDLSPDFSGTVQAISNSRFALLGLRQRIADGSLAALGASPTALTRGASQLLFALDAGLDPTTGDFSELDLMSGTVRQLTGADRPVRIEYVRVSNSHPSSAVTLHLRYLNDRCQEVFGFLLVLDCQDTVTLDPFDFEIPFTTVNTSQRFFGTGNPGQGPDRPLSAWDFGSGRFVLSVTAVGSSLEDDDSTDVLFPFEFAGQEACNVSDETSGAEPGFSAGNLHVCNARTMSFNYLQGTLSQDEEGVCSGRRVLAGETLIPGSDFTRRLRRELASDLIECLTTTGTESCQILPLLEGLGDNLEVENCSEEPVGAAVEVRIPAPTFRLLPIVNPRTAEPSPATEP